MNNINLKATLFSILAITSAQKTYATDFVVFNALSQNEPSSSGYFFENTTKSQKWYALIDDQDQEVYTAFIQPGTFTFVRSNKIKSIRFKHNSPILLPSSGTFKGATLGIKIGEGTITPHKWTGSLPDRDYIRIINKTKLPLAGTVKFESGDCDWCCADETIFIPASGEKVVNTQTVNCSFTRINLASFKGPGWTNPVFYDLKKKIKSDAIVIITDPENSTHGNITVAAEQVAR